MEETEVEEITELILEEVKEYKSGYMTIWCIEQKIEEILKRYASCDLFLLNRFIKGVSIGIFNVIIVGCFMVTI